MLAIFLMVLSFALSSCLNPDQTPTQIACTEEAKQCTDGSYVSRTGANCEFTPCAGKTTDILSQNVFAK